MYGMMGGDHKVTKRLDYDAQGIAMDDGSSISFYTGQRAPTLRPFSVSRLSSSLAPLQVNDSNKCSISSVVDEHSDIIVTDCSDKGSISSN